MLELDPLELEHLAVQRDLTEKVFAIAAKAGIAVGASGEDRLRYREITRVQAADHIDGLPESGVRIVVDVAGPYSRSDQAHLHGTQSRGAHGERRLGISVLELIIKLRVGDGRQGDCGATRERQYPDIDRSFYALE
jgi:hypothetical protein